MNPLSELRGGIDGTVNFQVKINGKRIKGDIKSDFRIQSTVYTATSPDGNILQAVGYPTITEGTYWGADDGVYMMIEPLSPGNYTLYFTGRFPQYDFTLEFTYYLTVFVEQ